MIANARGCVDPLNDPAASAAEIRVGYLGPTGTFSHQAAYLTRELIWALSNQPAKPGLVSTTSFEELLQALSVGEMEFAALPLINSSTGLVDMAAEALLRGRGIVEAGGIVDVGVSFDLFASNKLAVRSGGIAADAGSDLDDGMSAYRGMSCFSHPQALSQCAGFLLRFGLVPVPAHSTAAACRRAFNEDALAIAGPRVGEEYELSLLSPDVGDRDGALTRFLLLGNRGFFNPPRRLGANRRSLWIVDASSTHTQAGVLEEESSYSEIIVGKTGLALALSKTPGEQDKGSQLVSDGYFGNLPWPPNTPIFRKYSQAWMV